MLSCCNTKLDLDFRNCGINWKSKKYVVHIVDSFFTSSCGHVKSYTCHNLSGFFLFSTISFPLQRNKRKISNEKFFDIWIGDAFLFLLLTTFIFFWRKFSKEQKEIRKRYFSYIKVILYFDVFIHQIQKYFLGMDMVWPANIYESYFDIRFILKSRHTLILKISLYTIYCVYSFTPVGKKICPTNKSFLLSWTKKY